MLMVSSMASFHSSCQNDWNEVQHCFLVICCHWHWLKEHMILLALSNCTTVFVRPRWLKWGAKWLFWSCHAIGTNVGIALCTLYCQRNHYIPYIKTINMRSNMTFLVKWHNCHSIGITWCHWYWHHILLLTSGSVSHDAYSIINGTIIFLGQDDRSELQHDILGHMIPWHWHRHHVMQTTL